MGDYKYRGFGLNIESEIALPELIPHHFQNPDIVIRTGAVPPEIEAAKAENKVGVSISPTEYLFRIAGIAAYYACNGNKIVISPEPLADDKSIRVFLLDNVIAALLLQRNLIALNA